MKQIKDLEDNKKQSIFMPFRPDESVGHSVTWPSQVNVLKAASSRGFLLKGKEAAMDGKRLLWEIEGLRRQQEVLKRLVATEQAKRIIRLVKEGKKDDRV